jgi:hypothetical protein
MSRWNEQYVTAVRQVMVVILDHPPMWLRHQRILRPSGISDDGDDAIPEWQTFRIVVSSQKFQPRSVYLPRKVSNSDGIF